MHESSDWPSTVNGLRNTRVLVLGDLILDAYVQGDVTRISPEAPVPVVTVTQEDHRLGGAANVAANLASLDVACRLVGVVGNDSAAYLLRERLGDCGIGLDGIVSDGSRPTSLKTRVLARHQQIVRLDRESSEPLSGGVRDRVEERVRYEIGAADAVIVADYEKGLLDEWLIATVRELAHERGIPMLVDPKTDHFSWYGGVTCITPNVAEASGAAGRPVRSEADILAVGTELLSRLGVQLLLITRGPDGMSLIDRREPGMWVTHIPTVAREVYDVTGAGDTVVAVLGAALAAGVAAPAAARMANYAAGIVVGHLGCATVTRKALLAAIKATSDEDAAKIRSEPLV